MIRYLEGTVLSAGADHAILVVGGVGYKVHATPETIARCSEGELAQVHTYLAVRENALDLYGFLTTGELSLFELLLTVSGIGPKSALGVLSLASPEAVRTAIHEGDASYLTKVSGIGKKTAEKIVHELKDKAALLGEVVARAGGDDDAIEALHAMGYTLQEARDAMKRVARDVEGGSARLREALKQLGNGHL